MWSVMASINNSISFNYNNDNFSVLIKTERCEMRQAEEIDLMDYISLWQDPQVIAFNGDGQPKSVEWITDFVLNKSQFKKGSYFGCYSAFQKDGTFIGSFSLEPQTKQGEISIGLLLHKKFHQQRFGSEIAEAIKKYICLLRENDFFKMNLPIDTVVASAHPDNVASWKLQETFGLKLINNGFIQESKPRKFYRLDF